MASFFHNHGSIKVRTYGPDQAYHVCKHKACLEGQLMENGV